jgi:mannose-6-phosphate isomerase-like protein (cupin superfamily)
MPQIDRAKKVVMLARTDHMIAAVQVLKEGGENNLHSHPHLDGFWMVLGGRAKFYGENDVLIADLGPHEGVLIPRNTRYWFESSSDDVLELLQVEAFSKPLRTNADLRADRIDHQPLKEATIKAVAIDGRSKD